MHEHTSNEHTLGHKNFLSHPGPGIWCRGVAILNINNTVCVKTAINARLKYYYKKTNRSPSLEITQKCVVVCQSLLYICILNALNSSNSLVAGAGKHRFGQTARKRATVRRFLPPPKKHFIGLLNYGCVKFVSDFLTTLGTAVLMISRYFG